MSAFGVKTGVVLVVLTGLLAVPTTALAQSAIAGVVTDTTGAVLPGVTVEARSPALIEQVRAVVTDGQGQYRIIDLRPGEYTVTFTLTGFNTVVREGIVLEANFTAPVNVQMRVGALEETVTVSGASPVVDVQSTQRREVVTRELIEVLPTGRSYLTIAATLPAVNVNRFDVGGSTQMWQGQATAYGGTTGDFSSEVDGMKMDTALSRGQLTGHYLDIGSVAEYVVQVSAGTAETQTGGVKINMIPREGGNQFSGEGVAFFSNDALQSKNVSDALRARGVQGAPKIDRVFDYNVSLGGPIVRTKLWFFTSSRVWTFDREVVNMFHDGKLKPAGTPVVDANLLQAYNNRLTWQAHPKHKITAMMERTPKSRDYMGIENGDRRPEAAVRQVSPNLYLGQVKWTATLTSRVLLEAGYSVNYYSWGGDFQPEIRRPSATDPYGDIAKIELLTNISYNAPTNEFRNPLERYFSTASLNYVTGSHAVKFGYQLSTGGTTAFRVSTASMRQRYRGGVPNSVDLYNFPIIAREDIVADLGLFVQDSWTLGRLTLNPGVRYDYFHGEVPEQRKPAGPYAPARDFAKVPNLPNWKDVSPRFGGAYDLFGGGKTVIKGSVGRFVQQEATSFQARYNPMVQDSDRRNWDDLNGNDIAEPNELGPSTNLNFGVRRSRNADPDLQRIYNILYNLAVEHELRPGLGLSVAYNRRTFDDLTWTDNLATTHADYTLFTVPDPRGNGQTLPVYVLSRAKLGLVNELDLNSNDKRIYDGADVLVHGRLANGAAFSGGTSTGRTVEANCEVDNPNSLRFCDERDYDIPFRTTFKLSGSYPLPGGFRVSGVFQSVAGNEIRNTHVVTRTQLPSLTVSSVSVRLNEPGTQYLDRVNQLDISLAGTIPVGRLRVKPQIDLFNALNAGPVLRVVSQFGPALGRPSQLLDGRLLRLGLQVDF